MIVRYWMTPSPHTIVPMATLLEVIEIFRRERVRRLPVVDSTALVGMISRSDLYPIVNSHLLRGNVALPQETKDLLRSHKVHSWMTSRLEVCSPNDPIEHVGERMLERQIGALPVVHDQSLVGIITESDIFKAFTRIARAGAETRRICLLVPHAEQSETIARLVSLAHEYEAHIFVVLCHNTDRPGEQLVMARIGGPKTQLLIDRLWRTRMQVLQVV
ncbi:MAG: CBS domain-containing protein [Acidobacteriota bacterium]